MNKIYKKKKNVKFYLFVMLCKNKDRKITFTYSKTTTESATNKESKSRVG